MDEFANIEIQDIKHSLAGVGSVFAWMFAHSTEIGFILASGVSGLTIVYLLQGIRLRSRDLKKEE